VFGWTIQNVNIVRSTIGGGSSRAIRNDELRINIVVVVIIITMRGQRINYMLTDIIVLYVYAVAADPDVWPSKVQTTTKMKKK